MANRSTFAGLIVAGAALMWSLALPSPVVGAGQDARQQAVVVDHDDITIRGCVGRSPTTVPTGGESVLVWTRGDIMLSKATSVGAGEASPLNERVFYWLDDEEDLAKHVGQLVEVKGDIKDFEKGELEMKKDGDFTNIELKLGGKTEKARIPTSWLGTAQTEGEFDLVARKIDVNHVKVLGACTVR